MEMKTRDKNSNERSAENVLAAGSVFAAAFS
jgi:hypothetical protein